MCQHVSMFQPSSSRFIKSVHTIWWFKGKCQKWSCCGISSSLVYKSRKRWSGSPCEHGPGVCSEEERKQIWNQFKWSEPLVVKETYHLQADVVNCWWTTDTPALISLVSELWTFSAFSLVMFDLLSGVVHLCRQTEVFIAVQQKEKQDFFFFHLPPSDVPSLLFILTSFSFSSSYRLVLFFTGFFLSFFSQFTISSFSCCMFIHDFVLPSFYSLLSLLQTFFFPLFVSPDHSFPQPFSHNAAVCPLPFPLCLFFSLCLFTISTIWFTDDIIVCVHWFHFLAPHFLRWLLYFPSILFYSLIVCVLLACILTCTLRPPPICSISLFVSSVVSVWMPVWRPDSDHEAIFSDSPGSCFWCSMWPFKPELNVPLTISSELRLAAFSFKVKQMATCTNTFKTLLKNTCLMFLKHSGRILNCIKIQSLCLIIYKINQIFLHHTHTVKHATWNEMRVQLFRPILISFITPEKQCWKNI